MNGILTPEQTALMRAFVVSDQEMKDRVSSILEVQDEAAKKLAELRDQEATNRTLVADAADKLAKAESLAATADAKERAVAEVQKALEAEKVKFNEVRVAVGDEHRNRARSLDQLTAMLNQHEADLVRRDAAAVELAKQHEAEGQRLAELRAQLDRDIDVIRNGAGKLTEALIRIGSAG